MNYQVQLDEKDKDLDALRKEVIQKEDVMKMKRYEKMYTILLIVTLVSVAPLFIWLGNKVTYGIEIIGQVFLILTVRLSTLLAQIIVN